MCLFVCARVFFSYAAHRSVTNAATVVEAGARGVVLRVASRDGPLDVGVAWRRSADGAQLRPVLASRTTRGAALVELFGAALGPLFGVVSLAVRCARARALVG